MAIGWGTIGSKSAGGTTTLTIAHPASVAAGDLLITARCVWTSSAGLASDESGWTPAGDLHGGTGASVDAHTTRIRGDYKIAVGGESGNVTFDQSGTLSGARGVMARYTNGTGGWDVTPQTATDNTHGADRSVTLGTAHTVAVGEWLVALVTVDTDAALTITDPTFTGTATFGTVNRRTSGTGVTTGQDGNIELFDVEVTGAGTCTGFSMTTTTNQCGPIDILLLQEADPPPQIYPVHHSSGPAIAKATNYTTITTASFTPLANSAIVVGYTSDISQETESAATISNTGGLTFTLIAQRRSNFPTGADPGVVSLWTAKSGSSPTAMTVTCSNHFSGNAVPQMLLCRVYDPVDVDPDDPIGAVTQGSITSGTTLSTSITPEASESGLRMMWLDWNATGIPTAFLPNNTDTNLVDGFHNSGLSTNIQLAKTHHTTVGVAETIGATLLSSSTDGNWIAYELKGPATGAQNVVVQVLTTASTLFNPTVVRMKQEVVVQLLTAASTVYNPIVAVETAIVVVQLFTTSSTIPSPTVIPGTRTLVVQILSTVPTIYIPAVVPGSVTTVVQLLTITSTILSPTSAGQITLPILNLAETILSPLLRQITKLLVVTNPSSVFQPQTLEEIQLEVIADNTDLFSPTTRQLSPMPVLASPSSIYNPQTGSGAGGEQTTILDALNTPTTLHAPTTTAIVPMPVLTTIPIILNPKFIQQTKVPVLAASSSVLIPLAKSVAQISILNLAPTVLPPSVSGGESPPSVETRDGLVSTNRYPPFPIGLS